MRGAVWAIGFDRAIETIFFAVTDSFMLPPVALVVLAAAFVEQAMGCFVDDRARAAHGEAAT